MPEPLTLAMTFEGGEGELELADLKHPLVRPFRKACESGKPMDHAVLFLLRDHPELAPLVIGTLLHSAGNRLIFFPGTQIFLVTEGAAGRFHEKELDHLTLDPPRPDGTSVSHAAVFGLPKKKSRGIKYRTRPPAGSPIPWFSLLTPALLCFQRLPRKLSVSFPPPRPDVHQFGNDLFKRGWRLSIGHTPQSPDGRTRYLQIDFWVGREENWQRLRTRPLPWMFLNEVIEGSPPGSQTIQAAQGDVVLAGGVGIRIVITQPEGLSKGAHILRPRIDPEWLKDDPAG